MRKTALLIALAGCASGPLSSETRYAGRITPENKCGAETSATLVVKGGRFSFAPTDGVLLITGDVGADGTLSGRLTTPGVDHKPFTMTLAARVLGDQVDGGYVTPRCRYNVSLRAR